jgi:hypothetical protein
MKAKKITLFFVILGFCSLAKAQDIVNKSTLNTTFLNSSFKDNFYLSAGFGQNHYIGDYGSANPFKNGFAPALNISAGKDFNPIISTRIQFTGLSVDGTNTQNKRLVMNFLGANADLMLNLNNFFGYYNPQRFFSAYLIGGIGWNYVTYKDTELPKNNVITNRLGTLLEFNLSNNLYLTTEFAFNLVPDNYNGINAGLQYDCYGQYTIGLKYYINKKDFVPVKNN